VEASILATRVGIMAAADIREEMQRLAVLVQKTGGSKESRAFDFLRKYIESHLN
jgi:hypothetical protein